MTPPEVGVILEPKTLLVIPTLAEQKMLARMRQAAHEQRGAAFVVMVLDGELIWTLLPKLEIAKE